MLRTAITIGLVLSASVTVADEQRGPERWESDIAAMESRFRDAGSPTGRILFVGSSSIRLWDLKKSFPDRATLGHGFGGCETSDVVHFFDRIVTPVRPSAIVLYAGDNDIAREKLADKVHQDFLQFVKLTRSRVGSDVPIHFIAIKPSLSRWKLRETMMAANAAIQQTCDANPQLHYIDIWTPMLGDDGTPRKELFLDDGLHLNAAGYQLWSDRLRQSLN